MNHMHAGKASETCPALKAHTTHMDMVTEEKYLGDIISNDRKHTKTYYPEDPRDLESLMKSLEYSTA